MEASLLRCARQLSGLSQVEAARLDYALVWEVIVRHVPEMRVGLLG